MKSWIWGAAWGTVLAGVGVVLYATLVERGGVQLDKFTLESDHPGLPPDGITILHLSDFHFRAAGAVQARKIARLRQLLSHERYDLVALTGDLIHDAEGFPTALALLETLRPRLAAFSCPGNHDYAEYSVWGVFGQSPQDQGRNAERFPGQVAPHRQTAHGISTDGGSGTRRQPTISLPGPPGVARAGGSQRKPFDRARLRAAGSATLGVVRKLVDFAGKVARNELVRLPVAFNDVPTMHAALAARGIQPLVNRAVPVRAEGTDVWVAGVDDPTEGQPDLHAALADVPDDALLILLAHNPDIWLDRRVLSADLVLAGHTHGGQVRLPILGAIHTQGTHLTRQRPAGWFRRQETRMFVIRGLGESIPLRLGVRPQAALIRLASPSNSRSVG